MSSDEAFSPEYVSLDDTADIKPSNNKAQEHAMSEIETEIQEQAQQHGTGKPRRVIITAKISHD